MNNLSLGILEYRSIAIGMKAVDAALKVADVDLVFAKPMCPGKYVVALKGKLSSVQAAVDKGISDEFQSVYVDHAVLGNPDEGIFAGLYQTSNVKDIDAVGILETYSVATVFTLADVIVKTTDVSILEIRIAKGISGKAYVVFSGELAAVTASMEKAKKEILENALIMQTSVIPRPDPRLWEEII